MVTIVWGGLFGIPVTIDDCRSRSAVALPACVIAIGLLGLITAATFVLYRSAFALGIAMQYPVSIVTGLLFRLSLLPAWIGPISWILAPTWGFRAQGGCARRVALVVDRDVRVVSACIWRSRSFCLAYFERLARSRASLRLA